MGFWGDVWGGVSGAGSWLKDQAEGITGTLDRSNNEFRDVDPDRNLYRLGRHGEKGYVKGASRLDSAYRGMGGAAQNLGGVAGRMGGAADMMQRRAMGEDSLSAEQLRQNLGQTLSMQRSMAAGARPGNAAMAARTAATQMGRQSSGLAGQQAMAGIAERHAAQQAYQQALAQQGQLYGAQGSLYGDQGNLAGQWRGQDLDAAKFGYGGIESGRTSRFGAMLGVPTGGERLYSAAQGIGSWLTRDRKRPEGDK